MARWMGHSSAGRRNRSRLVGGNLGKDWSGLVSLESFSLDQSIVGSSLLVCLVSPGSLYAEMEKVTSVTSVAGVKNSQLV